MNRELVVYTRTIGCPFITIAKRVLGEHNVTYREVYIDKDPIARDRLRDWTGFLSVPTLFVAYPGEVVPVEIPPRLPAKTSPQGVDRGVMISEPRDQQLLDWLKKNGFIDA
jgi:glutaredoxin